MIMLLLDTVFLLPPSICMIALLHIYPIVVAAYDLAQQRLWAHAGKGGKGTTLKLPRWCPWRHACILPGLGPS